jgi:hypothetical protein
LAGGFFNISYEDDNLTYKPNYVLLNSSWKVNLQNSDVFLKNGCVFGNK